MEMKIFYNRVAGLCGRSYVVLGVWPVLFVIGMLVQCLITGKERQKEDYTFMYRPKNARRPVYDDESHLIRHTAPDRYSMGGN